jgi:hypothetical protein
MPRSGPSLYPYSPKCEEGVFSEVRIDGFLRSSFGPVYAENTRRAYYGPSRAGPPVRGYGIFNCVLGNQGQKGPGGLFFSQLLST